MFHVVEYVLDLDYLVGEKENGRERGTGRFFPDHFFRTIFSRRFSKLLNDFFRCNFSLFLSCIFPTMMIMMMLMEAKRIFQSEIRCFIGTEARA